MSENFTIHTKNSNSLSTRVKGIQKRPLLTLIAFVIIASGGYYEAKIEKIVAVDYVETIPDQYFRILEDTNKMGLILFYTDYCFPCEQMNQLFMRNNNIATLVNQSFVPYKVDAFDKSSGDALREKYNIDQFPTLLITDGNGGELKRISDFEDSFDFYQGLTQLTNKASAEKPTFAIKTKNSEEKAKPVIKDFTKPKRTKDVKSFALLLDSYDSYDDARGSALLKTQIWNKEIWIEKNTEGQYAIMLGMFERKKEGKVAMNYLRSWEGITSEVQELNPLAQKY